MTVHIRGSWGTIVAHAATGIIVSADHEELSASDIAEGITGYREIARFDPVVFQHVAADSLDILETGYWTTAGDYAEPLTQRCVDDPRQGLSFDDWVPLRLLPAPAVSHA